jgi:hypothetical protein
MRLDGAGAKTHFHAARWSGQGKIRKVKKMQQCIMHSAADDEDETSRADPV